MSLWRRHSIQRSIRARLTATIVAGTAAAAVALLTVMILLEASSVRRELLERTQVTARLVGEYCVTPIAFGDVAGAERALSRLGGFPAITHARLLDETGHLIATFDRTGAPSLGMGTPAAGHHSFGAGTLDVHQEIEFDGSRYGSLLVRSSTGELAARLRASVTTAALALLVVLGASWLLARRLHRGFSTRILGLATTMERVTRERDFTLRAEEEGEDEIAALGRGFNEMLEQVRLHQVEREEAQARLARLGTAVEHAGEEVLITDAAGIVQYVNPEFTRKTGFTSGDALGRPLASFSANEPGGAAPEEPWSTLRTGRPWSGRVCALRSEGQPLTEDATFSPIPGPSGEVLGYVVVRRDVTDRIRMERQLNQNQKMEALGTLAGGIAHDFNNILAAMIGLTELARTELPRDSAIAANLEDTGPPGWSGRS
jgi:PAS domain S-box-containing protein